MGSHTLSMIKYWRKALIDGKSQKGLVNKKDIKQYIPTPDLSFGNLSGEALEKWREHLGDDKNCDSLFVVPFVYIKRYNHGHKLEDNDISYLIPLYIACTADKDGHIAPHRRNIAPCAPRYFRPGQYPRPARERFYHRGHG